MAQASAGPICEVRRATRIFRRDPGPLARLLGVRSRALRAVDGVDLVLERGQTLGLVGESGSGKSTLGRMIVGLEPADEGEIHFDGLDVSRMSREERHRFHQRVQVVFQNPYASLNPRHSVRTMLGVALALRGVRSHRDRDAESISLLERVGLAVHHLDAYPHQFSGGQRQRLAIARALAMRPELLVLDEPTSALDVSIQAQVLELLEELQGELGMTYLFISHNIAVIAAVADRVAVMRRGRLVESGPVDEIVGSPSDPYTQALLGAVPTLATA